VAARLQPDAASGTRLSILGNVSDTGTKRAARGDRLRTILRSYFMRRSHSCLPFRDSSRRSSAGRACATMLLVLLLVCVGSLQAQNTVALSPSTVFLKAALNGGPIQATVAVTSSPGTVGISVAPPTVPWLTVSQGTPNTPTSLTVTGNPSGL